MQRDVAQFIQSAIVFAFPIGAMVMHRHYEGGSRVLRAVIIVIRILALLSAPFALLILYSVVMGWLH
jgi:hypothetical protein